MTNSTNGEVYFQQGVTLQMGGPGSYEFVRLDVGIRLPVLDGTDAEDTMSAAVSFVEEKLEEQIRETRGEPAKKTTKKPRRKKRPNRKS